MAKRLTDTEKWNDDWYISLCNDYRIIWQWLLDNCNHAGVCKRSMKLLNMMCNTAATESEMIEKMDGRVVIVKNDWFIPKFLHFQYEVLTSNRPVVISVVKELEKNDLLKIIPESLLNDLLIIKEKRKDKDKDKHINAENNGNSETKYSGNFKARGEEVLAKRLADNLAAANGSGKEDNKSKT